MQITNVKNRLESGQIILSADIIVGRKNYNIWFSVDEKYSDLVQLNVNPFVPCSFMIASKVGENLIIEGEKVDPVLKANTAKANELLTSWDLGFKKAKLIAETSDENQHSGPYTGLFFSGGVDSFYSLLKQRQAPEPEITHLVYIYGYDVDLKDTELFGRVYKNVKAIADKSNKKLIIVKTNIKELVYDYLPWIHVFGGCLSSVGLFLGKGLGTAYIAAGADKEHSNPWGSHPDLDLFWSSSTTKIVHDGAERGRLDKVKYIVSAPGAELVFNHLRVCFLNPKGVYNCGKCEKCLRTLVELRAAKADKKMKVFDIPLEFENINKLDLKSPRGRSRFVEVLEDIKKTKDDPEMEAALEKLLNGTSVNSSSAFSKMRTYIAEIDIKYNRARLGRLLKRNRLI